MAETFETCSGNPVVIASRPISSIDADPPVDHQEDVLFANSEELLRYLEAEGVRFVDVRFCDLLGIMQHFAVAAESFDENDFTEGLAFDGSSIRGLQRLQESEV